MRSTPENARKGKAPPAADGGGANAASARNDGHFLNRPPRKNLNAGLGDVDHLFDANALTLAIALLGLNREAHILLDHHRVIKRAGTPDQRWLVKGQTDAMRPVAARGLIQIGRAH